MTFTLSKIYFRSKLCTVVTHSYFKEVHHSIFIVTCRIFWRTVCQGGGLAEAEQQCDP